jgi:hypothetical protein
VITDYRQEENGDWMKKRRREKNAAANTRYSIFFGLEPDVATLFCPCDYDHYNDKSRRQILTEE